MKRQSYSLHVSKQTRALVIFGDDNQHDPDEFFEFIMTQLEDETNRNRDQKEPPLRRLLPLDLDVEADFTDIASELWAARLGGCESIVEKFFRHYSVTVQRCMGCNYRSIEFETQIRIQRSLGEDTHPTTLEALLRGDQRNTISRVDDCDGCHRTTNRQRIQSYYQLPDVLAFTLTSERYDAKRQGSFKIHRKVTWELDNFDMSEFGKAARGKSNIYECFAVIQHLGDNTQSGHYTSYIRSAHDNSTFMYFNDSKKPEEVKGAERRRLFGDGGFTPRMVFFRRKGSKKSPAVRI